MIVLNRAYRGREIATRVHTIVRFLTCPFGRVLDHLPRGAKVLDVGAGHGLFAVLARDRGARVVAVEPDLRKILPVDGIPFVAGYDDVVRGSFDAVSIIDVLYKIPLGDWDALLDRAAERLAPGGTLIVKEQDPTARLKNWWNRLQERLVSVIGLTLGESFTYEAPDAFASRLKRHGFAGVVVERVDRGYPHPHVLYVASRNAPARAPAPH